MRIGMSLSSTRSGDDHGAGARSILARATAADAVGLDSITLGDHHAMSTPYFQNVPMLGRAMASISPDRSVGCLFLLPLWHPVLVAEQVATLATLSEAPFIIQTGIGAGELQFAAMGVSLQARGTTLEESVRVISALLRGETVSSEHFGISEASISPLPPHGVEWWIGAGVDKALRRAALIGDAWYTNPHYTPAQLRPSMRTYEQACAVSGRSARTVLRKDVLVLRNGDRAHAVGKQILEGGYRGMQSESVVIGNVEEAIEQLGAFAELGVADVMVRCMTSDDALAIETIECFGDIRSALGSAGSAPAS